MKSVLFTLLFMLKGMPTAPSAGILPRQRLRKLSFVAALGVLLVGSVPLSAQTLELGASVGWYRPLRTFAVGPILSTDLPVRASQLQGIALGGEARLTLRDRVGVEAIFQSAASTLPGCLCPGGPTGETGERVSLAAVEGLYNIAIYDRTNLSIGLGPAMIEHGGEGYGRYGSPKSWGGAGSVEVTRALTSHFEVAARALGTAYSFHLDFPPENGRQLDLLIALSARLRFGAESGHER